MGNRVRADSGYRPNIDCGLARPTHGSERVVFSCIAYYGFLGIIGIGTVVFRDSVGIAMHCDGYCHICCPRIAAAR
jgi:hypothetical protein